MDYYGPRTKLNHSHDHLQGALGGVTCHVRHTCQLVSRPIPPLTVPYAFTLLPAEVIPMALSRTGHCSLGILSPNQAIVCPHQTRLPAPGIVPAANPPSLRAGPATSVIMLLLLISGLFTAYSARQIPQPCHISSHASRQLHHLGVSHQRPGACDCTA